jgi:hypothetical protein
MTRKILSIALAAMVLSSGLASAQEFAEKNMTFSYKKPTYVYLENGDSIIGEIAKVGYKKGLIDELKIKKEGEKKGVEVDINTIKKVYFPLATIANFASKMNVATNATKWDKTGVNERLMADGYVLYEKTATMVKKKEEVLLMQLVNPAFSNKIRVYADPYAAESNSYGIGGVKLAGGDDLSYYVKKGDQVAIKLQRKDFKENIDNLFSDCPALAARLKENSNWKDFAEYVTEHSNCQ